MRTYKATTSPITTRNADDAYHTRLHAFNVGLAYTVGSIAITIASTLTFSLSILWVARGFGLSLFLGAIMFCVYLYRFTQEARDIQWQKNLPSLIEPDEPDEPDSNQHALITSKTSLPSPRNKNGTLWITVNLNNDQRESIARTALRHGKLTVNYLQSIGLRRAQAERLREELVRHDLLMFNDRNEAVVTNDGVASFKKIIPSFG